MENQSKVPAYRLNTFEVRFLLGYMELESYELADIDLDARKNPKLIRIYENAGVPGWQTEQDAKKLKWIRNLLKKPDAQLFIQEVQRSYIRYEAASANVTPKKVLEAIDQIAHADMTSCIMLTAVMPGEGKNDTDDTLYKLHVKPIDQWSKACRTALKKIKVNKDGTAEIEFYDKLRALHIQGSHLGLFNNFYQAISTLEQYGIHLAPNPHNHNQWVVINQLEEQAISREQIEYMNRREERIAQTLR